MRLLRTIRVAAIVPGMSIVSAAVAFFVWFGWKWGAHYAGVWWRGVRERLEAGDTTINQASWWMRDRWETLRGVLSGPKIDSDSAPQMLATIGAVGVIFLLLRVPGMVLAGWLGRRAIRRDGILCEPGVAKSLGRRVLVDGALRWVVPAGVAVGAAMALINHLSTFGAYLISRESRIVAFLCTPLAFLVVDVLCSLRWSRHLIARNIRGRQRMCRGCGFDVTSLGDGVCSECGMPVDSKARDVGVRVLVRPRGARVAAAVAAALFLISAGFGWAIANTKGVEVVNEARRLADALLMQRPQGRLSVFIPAGQVMVIEDRGVHMLMRVVERPPGPIAREDLRIYMRAVCRVVVTESQTEPLNRRRLLEMIPGLPGRSPWAGEPAPQVELSADPPEPGWGAWVRLPRRVRVARLVQPDLSDPDQAWLVGGEGVGGGAPGVER